jgi:predicted CoA-binding protein
METDRKKTLILGASTNPDRYAYRAASMLTDYGNPIGAVGNKKGEVFGVQIQKDFPTTHDIDTVTLYLSAPNQVDYYDLIVALNPNRLIFNPGTENPELENLLLENHIAFEHACTLVLLSIGAY